MKYVNLFGFFIWYYTLRMHNFANSALDYENWYCFISIKFDFKKKLIICRNFIASQGVSQALFDDVYVIFPIHVNFPITSRFLDVMVEESYHSNSELFYVTCESFFFKKTLYDVVYACCTWLIFPFYHDGKMFLLFMFLYLSFIIYFRHVTFYTCGSCSIFVKDFPFSSFLLIF